MSQQDELKRAAALYAIETFIKPGMFVGLGSGSTSEIFVAELGRLAQAGQFGELTCVATSEKVEQLAKNYGLKIVGLNEVERLDVTIDGADEIEPGTYNVTKGRGGAQLREKLVAVASNMEVIIADESKVVSRLGEKMPVPVEVIPFGWQHTAARLAALGCEPVLRQAGEQIYLTDSNNYILDCRFAPLENASETAEKIKNITGVVEHGLFIGIVRGVVIASASKGVYQL